MSTSPWILRPEPRPNAAWRLVCFHHAGGNAAVFHPWAKKLPPSIELLAVQLPGRGSRMLEPRIERWDALDAELTRALLPWASGRVAFFGHSLGGLVAYEMAKRLAPSALFLSGARAAHVFHRSARRKYADLSEAELVADLSKLGGTPREFLEDPELRELVLPVVRSDYRLVDNYRYQESPGLKIPIQIYGGKGDAETDEASLRAWGELTTAASDLRWFEGGHFYLFDETDALLADIRARLEAIR